MKPCWSLIGFASVQLLPEFPSFNDFSPYLDPMISQAQFQSLVTMYRAHSQRIMDSVNKFSFVEIPNLFKHFWRELPNHIFCFIGHKSIVTYIEVCDKILYTTILKAILPTPLQVSKVEKILKGSLDSIPSPSPLVKIQIMGKTLLGVVNNFIKTKSLLAPHQQSFALLPQVTFPANNLYFPWRWRWWVRIQVIFLNLFYFKK